LTGRNRVPALSTLIADPALRPILKSRTGKEQAMGNGRMTAGDLCIRDVGVASRSTVLIEAAREMRNRHVGSLVVVDETPEGRFVVGMLTDRDIVTAVVARDVDASTLRAGDVMSEDVACVREDDSVADVLAVMQRRHVRRLPVIGPRQRLLGVIAADDLLRLLAGQLQALSQVIGDQVRVEQMVRP
jgi:CBS domain-containing protein